MHLLIVEPVTTSAHLNSTRSRYEMHNTDYEICTRTTLHSLYQQHGLNMVRTILAFTVYQKLLINHDFEHLGITASTKARPSSLALVFTR